MKSSKTSKASPSPPISRSFRLFSSPASSKPSRPAPSKKPLASLTYLPSSQKIHETKAHFKTQLSTAAWFLRTLFLLALACNTLFLALGLATLPFAFLDPLHAITLILACVMAYLPTYLGDPATTGRREWAAFRKSFFMRDMIRWFKGDVVKTADIDPKEKHIFAVAPHGIMPLSTIWMFSHEKWASLFPSLSVIPLGSSVFHFAPLVRDLAMWSGTRQVTKATFKKTLHEGKSVAMIPGGISELRLSNSRSKTIELSAKHRGFVRMAITQGASIVPVFAFGETLTLDHVQVPLLSHFFYKYLRMPFPYFTGVGGFFQLPRRQPITMVVGRSIQVGKEENPSDERVREIHRLYYHEITALFEQHKHHYGHAEYSLRILHLD